MVDIRQELEGRLERARQQGLVDCKSAVDVSNDTSTNDLLLVLNNVLRIRETGLKPTFSC